MLKLVLLPGMDGTGTLFQPFVDALAGEFEIQIVRYPTHKAFGYEELEAFVRAALPTDSPFILLGESFSGPIAVSIAASKPAALVGLVLCCTFVRNPRPATSFFRSLVGFLPITLAPVPMLAHFLLGRHSTAELKAVFAESLAQVSTPAMRARILAVLSVDVTAKLHAISVPSLYMRATKDRVVPAAASRNISANLPSLKIVSIEAPHFLLQIATQQAAIAVKNFASALHESRDTE